MSLAGYDTEESYRVWERMKEDIDGKGPTEFWSTHPSPDNRIKKLKEWIPIVKAQYPAKNINMFAIKIEDLSHSIKEKNVLKNINLELEKDKIACLLGPSGSGKTTMLKLIAGLEKVQKGKIFFNDKLVSSENTHLKTEKRQIGFLFQDYALFPHLTVKENLNFPLNSKNSNYSLDDIINLNLL